MEHYLKATITERSTQPLTRDLYRRLEASEDFWELVARGVVSLVRSRDIPWGLRAAAFVGQATMEGNLRFVIEEKTPGALRALLRWAVPEDLRDAAVPSPVAQDSPLLDTFAREFVANMGYYLRHGRIKAYRREHEQSGCLRGRIDVKASVAMLARGKRGRLAYSRPRLTADILPNRLLALALQAVERLFGDDEDARDTVSVARVYAPLFEDVRWSPITRLPWSAKAAAFERVMTDSTISGDLRKALAYARALVLHLGAWPLEEESFRVPRSYFLNLETLFEEAVRQVAREVCAPFAVTRGTDLGRPLFKDLRDRYVADPDFVVARRLDDLIVGDCKYKQMDGHPAHSDVYQLAAHCSAMGSLVGVLVYPGEACSTNFLGTALTGTRVFWATVRPAALREDVAQVLDCLYAVPKTVSPFVANG